MMMDGPDALSAALRAVSFTLLLNAAGIPIFLAAFGRLTPRSLPDVRKLGWSLAISAMVFVAAHQALEAARMAGEMNGVLDPAMQKMALESRAGAAFAARMVGLALVAIGLRRYGAPTHAPPHAGRAAEPSAVTLPSNAQRLDPATVANATGSANAAGPANATGSANAPGSANAARPANVSRSTMAALLGTLLTIISFTLQGHTTTTPHRAAAAALVLLHLLVVAFWLGALWPLYMAAKKEPPAIAARVIDRFSSTATWLVPLILLAGIGLTAILLPSLDTFRHAYGQLLLVKLAGFAVLMAMASLNKWSFGPACAAGNTAAFERTVIVEFILITVVLTATAIMTMFYSPDAGPGAA
jgi:putative copper export protein